MGTEQTSLVDALERIYRQQATLYEEFGRVAQPLAQGFAESELADARLADLQIIMEKIHQLDLQLAPIRTQWESVGRPTTPSLNACLREVEGHIVAVMKSMEMAESEALAAKARLIPQMSAESRNAQRARAYQAARG